MQHIDDDQVKDLLLPDLREVIDYVEQVFCDYHEEEAQMVPKIYLDVENGDYRAMPASWGHYSGVKWISVYPSNRSKGLPTIHGTLLLNNTDTGQPVISMDCAELTAFRTAAVSAIAAKYLTPNTSVKTVAFIGCGKQALYHLQMYLEIFPNIERVSVYDRNPKSIDAFITAVLDRSLISNNRITSQSSIQLALKDADVITTLTPSTDPYLDINDLNDPFHINAVGADAVGKRELMANVLEDENVFLVVDDWEQASHSGETQYNKDLPYLLLSDIITNTCIKPVGKTTVFDSTGLAIEDIAIGRLIYERYCQGN